MRFSDKLAEHERRSRAWPPALRGRPRVLLPFHFVKRVDQVLDLAFLQPPERFPVTFPGIGNEPPAPRSSHPESACLRLERDDASLQVFDPRVVLIAPLDGDLHAACEHHHLLGEIPEGGLDRDKARIHDLEARIDGLEADLKARLHRVEALVRALHLVPDFLKDADG